MTPSPPTEDGWASFLSQGQTELCRSQPGGAPLSSSHGRVPLQTCCMGDEAVASLTSETPVLDARMESLFSFLRSRSTCRDAGGKSGLGLALGLEQNCCPQEEAGMRVAVGVGVSRGQQPREGVRRAQARAALRAERCCWGREVGPASQAF